MTVRIKRLELHGFKSFPRSTVFEFDSGITAVIGPNGSGKSNIADGMRWVLGEQSYTNLRSRRSEDVIFSGSSARSAAGMAEVTLTLDNTGGELPIEFQEVSITRRAYRSGENQYLINGARVRLRDVQHITSSLGQAHTVIGQGLVDAALSQRPEERRGLFEHAAGISGLRLKYSATARHLAETTANSTRLEDLLTELEPRLKTLERQAKQAREYAAVQQDLRETALRYYASLWREHETRLAACREAATATEAEVERVTASLEAAEAEVSRLSSELDALLQQSESLTQQVTRQQSHLREVEHQIDLTRQRRETMLAEIERYNQRSSGLVTEADQINQQSSQLAEDRNTVQLQVSDLDKRLASLQADRASLDTQISDEIAQRDELDSQREQLRQRIYRAETEQEYRRQQREDLQSRAETIAGRRAELEAEILEIERTIETSTQAIADLETSSQERSSEVSGLEAELASHREGLRKHREALDKLESERTRHAARLDALQRLQESGEGLHRGVQTVLDSARTGNLSGVVGTLASQISVPEHLETAIEAALGGHLQDIIVQRWDDAEAAIAHLKQSNAGRATFQPLDTQRRSGGQNRQSVPRDAGVHGIGVDLIEFAPELEPVIDGLIGRTIITDDLSTTRQILGKLRGGWTIVTLEGEVSRSAGSVTGGSRVRQSGTLGRERELRDLPVQIERIDTRRTALQQQIDETNAEIAEQETRLESARSALRTITDQIDSKHREQSALQHRLEQARQQLDQVDHETSDASRESEARSTEIEQLAEQCARDTEALAALEQQRNEIIARIDELQSGSDDETLRKLESEHSRLSERLQNLDQQDAGLRQRAERIQQEIQRLDAESATARQTIDQLDSTLTDLQEQASQTRESLEAVAGEIEPLTDQRATLQQRVSAQEEAIRTLQGQQRERERRRDSQRFDIEREVSQGDHLIERVTDILEIEDPVPLLKQQPVEEGIDHQKLETTLHRLRQRARRISAFGEDTITQYEQEQERFTFLRGQLDDVQNGAEALQSMLKDLERAMSEEFDRTFGLVAQAFNVTFQRLFGGGSAQLVRNDAEDSTGIDIVAQPPGKRLQSLALLSGGERALTAVALLFAIQRVNPSPFCLLDEVDAALDESNVVRFRDELRDLAGNTQFVVVTHNRATIEGADVLYGITMGDDAISRVVSMKLPEEAAVS